MPQDTNQQQQWTNVRPIGQASQQWTNVRPIGQTASTQGGAPAAASSSQVPLTSTGIAAPQGTVSGWGPSYAGDVIKRSVQGVGRGLQGMWDFGKGLTSDLGVYGPGALSGGQLLDKYVLDPAAHEKQRSLEEAQAFHNTQGLDAAGHAITSMLHTAGEFIPGAGPVVGNLVDRARSGDIAGATTEGATYALAPKVAKGVISRGAALGETISARGTLSDAIDAADGLSRKAKTLNVIDKQAQAVHNSVREQLVTLQGKLKADAQKSIQPFIDADKAAGSKPILPTQAAAEAAKALSQTDYIPKPAEQSLLDQLNNSPEHQVATASGYLDESDMRSQITAQVGGDAMKGDMAYRAALEQGKRTLGISNVGLDLDRTLKLRSAIGSAAARTKDPKAKLVLGNAYEGMNDAINARLNDLQGLKNAVDSNGKPTPNKAFTQYNDNHKAAFQLTDPDSFTRKLMDETLDHHVARANLEGEGKNPGFVNANLTQVAKQMTDKGMNPKEFYQLQKDAQTVLNARSSVMGKYNRSVMRIVMSGQPAEAMLPIGVYAMSKGAGLYGMVPFMLAAMAGKLPQSMAAMTDFAKVMKRMGISDKVLNTRVQPGAFTPVPVASPGPQGVGGLNIERGQPLLPSGGSGAMEPTDVESPSRGAEGQDRLSPDQLDSGAWSLYGVENFRDLSPEQQGSVVRSMSKTSVGQSIAHPAGRQNIGLPSNFPTPESRAASDRAFQMNYQKGVVPGKPMDPIEGKAWDDSMQERRSTPRIDTDALSQAYVKARAELGQDAPTKAVALRAQQIAGITSGGGDVGDVARRGNPEPPRSVSRGEKKAAQIKKIKEGKGR